jgi:hypothetical protein
LHRQGCRPCGSAIGPERIEACCHYATSSWAR